MPLFSFPYCKLVKLIQLYHHSRKLYVHTFIYVHEHTRVYTHTNKHIYIHVYIYKFIYVYICIYVCVWVSVCVCVCMCVCVCVINMYLCINIYVYTQTQAHHIQIIKYRYFKYPTARFSQLIKSCFLYTYNLKIMQEYSYILGLTTANHADLINTDQSKTKQNLS